MDETTLSRTLHDLAAEPPLHKAPSADARRRARRLQRQHRLTAAVGVVVVTAGAFGVRGITSSAGTTAGATPHNLTIQQVTYEAPCSSTTSSVPGEVKDRSGKDCYVLNQAALTIHPKSVAALHESFQGYLLQVSLNDADRVAFGALTARVVPLAPPLNQLAFVLDGVVLSAPSVQTAIDGGEVQITGGEGAPLTKADVDKLAAELRE